jgi:hypothetical protein
MPLVKPFIDIDDLQSTDMVFGTGNGIEAPWDMPTHQAAWKEYGLRIEEKRTPIVKQPTEELDGYIMGVLGMMG